MTDTQSTVPEAQQPALNIDDLAAARLVIKNAVERSTFKVEEMNFVMAVYNKFHDFVSYAEQIAEKAKADAETAASAVKTEVETVVAEVEAAV